MSLFTRYSLILAILSVAVIVAAGCGPGHGERLDYGGNEFFYTSALLDDEAAEIGDFIFENSGSDLLGSLSLQADKNGVRRPDRFRRQAVALHLYIPFRFG